MDGLDPGFVAATRRRDLLLTLVMLGILLTPAWLTPDWISLPWRITFAILGPPAVYFSWRYSPWWPTPSAELPRILHHLALSPGDAFCDLGAGDGRMVLWVHRATGARCVGIEISPLQYLLAQTRLAVQGTSGTTIRLGDLFAADLSGFDAVYIWGTAYLVSTPEFSGHVRTALRPGARLVSYHYPVPGLKAEAIDTDGLRPVYVYVPVPPRPGPASPGSVGEGLPAE
ncbi:MAG TPA: class I SAM-dependent methyltransferase [Deltaproteobacteria bacterium]|nr:class I SAM-dependent methyltransferase [Deltaproteobacteria bacterium]